MLTSGGLLAGCINTQLYDSSTFLKLGRPVSEFSVLNLFVGGLLNINITHKVASVT